LVELLGGHIDAVCCSVPEAAAQLEAGQLRALAVMSEERLEDFPDVPTTREQDVDWVAVGWRGLALPKDSPAEIVERLLEAGKRIAASDDYLDFMKKQGYTITFRSPDKFREFLAREDAMWKDVIEAAGYNK
jgi:tripartite-type tricarboxylate transporter receptor subunit TctC